MPTEQIAYPIVVTGQQAAAQAFQQVAQAQRASQTAADQLSQSLKASARTAEVESRAAARAYEQTARAAVTAGQAAKAANDGFGSLTNAAKGSAIALGQFGNAAVGLIPGIEGMGGAVVRASSVIGALSQQLGIGGPLAVAAGAAVAGIGLVAKAFSDARDRADEFTKAVDDSNRAANEAFFARSQRFYSAQTKAAAAEAERLRLAAGDQAVGSQGLGSAENTDTLAAINAAEKSAFGDRIPKAKPAARTGPAFDPYKAEQERLAQVKAIDAQLLAAADEQSARELDIKKIHQAAEQAIREQTLLDEKAAHDKQVQLYEEAAKREEAISRRKHQAITAVATQAYNAIAGSIAAALASAVTGENVSTKAVLHGIGVQAANMGFLNLLQAPVDLFWNPPKAAAELAAGTAEVALGATLGAATRGGGGSGGGPRHYFGPPVGPTVIAPSTATGAQNAAPITINNFPSIVSPGPDDNRRVQQAKAEARRQGR